MAFGGDITSITYNNPEVGSGVFKPKAGEGNTYDLGGMRYVDDVNSKTSDGTGIWTQNNKMGFFQVLIANDMNVNKDAEKIVALHRSTSDTLWTFTVVNGCTYRGKGRPVGDVAPDVDKATVSLKVNVEELEQV